MVAGFLFPVAQIAIAALFALPFRANVPVAALTTFITNPFTTPFLEQIDIAARTLGITAQPIMISSDQDYEPAFDEMASKRVHAVVIQPTLSRDRIMPLVLNDPTRQVFQSMLFSKIVPNCKKLGLLDRNDAWLRRRFEEMNVIQFEDWENTGDEYLKFELDADMAQPVAGD